MDPVSRAPISAKDVGELKAEIRKIVENLDPYSAVTEEEFDKAVVGLGLHMLLEGNRNWDDAVLKNNKILQKFPTLGDTYLICNVEKCPYYEMCPVMKRLTEAKQEELRGTACRADRLYAMELLVGLITELDIKPEAINDVILVADMVHYMIRKRQIRWEINKSAAMMIKVPAVVVQSMGKVVYKPEAHPLLQYEMAIDKQLESLRKQLIATRRERALLNPQVKQKDLLQMLKERMQQVALPQDGTPVNFETKEKD